MSYRTIAHHARSVRLTTSGGVFWLGSREQALPLQKVLISPKGVTTTDLCEVAESEGHAIGVAGVVIVGVAVVVHITEVVGVAGIIYSWYKNQSITKPAQVADDVMQILKDGKITLAELEDFVAKYFETDLDTEADFDDIEKVPEDDVDDEIDEGSDE